MGIIKRQLEKTVDGKNRQTCLGTTGVVLEYDKVMNKARVKFNNPQGEGYIIRENVPVSIETGGVTATAILPGSRCNLTFYGGNIHSPVITGIEGSMYNKRTSTDQGSVLVDESLMAVQEPEKIIPMCQQWLDEENEDVTKYTHDVSNFKDFDVDETVSELIATINKFDDMEEGIVHLDNKSTIKIKKNGDIDLFVSNNLGIRLSRSTQQIFVYGDLIVNGKPVAIIQE